MLKIKTFSQSYKDELDKAVNEFLQRPLTVFSIYTAAYGYGTSGHAIVVQIVYEEGTDGSKFAKLPAQYQPYTEPELMEVGRQE